MDGWPDYNPAEDDSYLLEDGEMPEWQHREAARIERLEEEVKGGCR